MNKDIQIDQRVRYLVDILNKIPGVSTSSSCGGHEGTLESSQLPSDEFYVDLIIEEDGSGWGVLEFLVEIIQSYPPGFLELKPWFDGGLRWDLHGYKSFNPDDLAKFLESALKIVLRTSET